MPYVPDDEPSDDENGLRDDDVEGGGKGPEILVMLLTKSLIGELFLKIRSLEKC